MSEQKISNKKIIGRGITKTVLILGTAGVIGYSVIKGKILGRPPSKIRKGLMYATVAGLILYKCQGDKLNQIYDYASTKVGEAYSEFYELKKNNNEKINYLMSVNDSLEMHADSVVKINQKITEENLEVLTLKSKLELTLVNYLKKDTVLVALNEENKIINEEKNNLTEKLNEVITQYNKRIQSLEQKINEKNQSVNTNQFIEKNKSQSEEILNSKYEDKKTQKEENTLQLDYLIGKELTAVKLLDGNYGFYESVNIEHKDWLWVFADENMSMDDLCVKYYGKKIMSEKINKYNRIYLYSYSHLPEGMPVALLEKGLITKEGVYKGGFPRAISVNDDRQKLDYVLKEYYSDEPENLDVLTAIKKYNELYGRDIDELKNKVEGTDGGYYVLIPRFLKFNISSGFSELWVRNHANSGEY